MKIQFPFRLHTLQNVNSKNLLIHKAVLKPTRFLDFQANLKSLKPQILQGNNVFKFKILNILRFDLFQKMF